MPTSGSADEGVHTKPAPFVIALTVTPVGIVSTIVVGLVEATGPEFEACTVKVKLDPCAALATLAILVTVKLGWLASGTVTVPPQRPAAGQPGSPLVVLAVLVTLLVPVLLTVSTATVAFTAPAATPLLDTQLT